MGNTMRKFTFVSEADGLELSAMEILPEGEVKAIVQIAHGMSEYKERYTDFMNFLAENGIAAVIHDHRGHGASVKSPNDLGFMYEGGKDGWIEDTHQLTRLTKERLGKDKPYCLLGHSMGSLIARCYAKKYDADIDKLVLLGSPSMVGGAGLGIFIADLAQKCRGEKGHHKLLDFLVIDMNYESRYKSEKTPYSWVSSDKAVVEKYNNDPLCGYRFTISGYKHLINLTVDTYDRKGWKMNNKSLPVAFFSGEGDPCAISKKAFNKSVQFMRDVGYENVTGKMYPQMRHEVLNEPGRQQVYEEILEFLNA
ncbi:MAG: alpha/beta fold hydrolase [Lachnospiraceae bacterium]